MTNKLRDKLIGAWELVSYVEKPLAGLPSELSHGRQAYRHHHVHA